MKEISMETFIVGCIESEFPLCGGCWWKEYCRSDTKVVGTEPIIFRIYDADIKPESLSSIF